MPNDLIATLTVKPVEVPTVRGLADAYVDNTISLGVANRRLQMIKEWSNAQKNIHDGYANE